MAFVLGGWALNHYLAEHELPNLTRVVYVRSPIEERMPRVITDDIPRMTRLARGRTPWDLRDTPYLPVETRGRAVGILVESRAIDYMRWRKEEVLALGELRWDPASFDQPHDDLLYLWLDHEQMYTEFDQIGPELLSFFESGRFTEEARRTPFDGDPFGAE
ncbi:MAG: hypothetical protein JRI55_18545 [Deltaproteobacteria bacterium]|jgi:hypothetical protein|nr:hypothetical protein [Deltaproteobacteria bacterium]